MTGSDYQISRTQEAEALHGKDAIIYQNITYQQVNSKVNFADTPNIYWISLGFGSKRERLFCNQNSPHLKLLFVDIKREINSQKKLHQLLITDILNIVCKKIKELNNLSEKNENIAKRFLAYLSKQKLSKEGHINIYLDILIYHKLLVCRHHALICSIMLGSLVKEGILPPGIVRQYRTSFSITPDAQIGHSWTVYRDLATETLWICDPTWNRVDLDKPDFSEHTTAIYRKVTLKKMSDHLKKLDTPLCLFYKIKQTESFSELLSLISHQRANIPELAEKRIESLSYSLENVSNLPTDQRNHVLSFITRGFGLRKKCEDLIKKSKLTR